MRKFCWFLLLALCASSASAAVINVPGDQPTIQAGIDSAAAGDTILVAPGAYEGTVDFSGKSLRIHSTAGPDSTFIRAMPDDTVASLITMRGLGSDTSGLVGFTIDSTVHTAGIIAIDSATHCKIEHCLVRANTGIDSAVLISLTGSDSCAIANCTFVDNDVSATIGGGGVAVSANIFADSGVPAGVDSLPRSCNCYVGAIAPDSLGDGSFEGDPLFCDTAGHDFTIANTSPCAPNNNACSTLIGAFGVGCYPYDGPVWYIALDGSDSTGNGSAEMPFATLQRAVDAAAPDDSVSVGPGTFVGPGNSSVTVPLSRLTISGSGRESTVIDANGGNLLLDFTAGPEEGDTVSIRHLSLTGAGTALEAPWPQAIFLDSVLLDKCDRGITKPKLLARFSIFSDNGVAIDDPSQSRFDSCSFELNRKAFTADGGAHTFDSCLFNANDTALTSPSGSQYTEFHINYSEARNGAVGYGGRYWTAKFISHSLVENMTVSALGSSGHLDVNDCIIRNNSGRLFYRASDKALQDSLRDRPHIDAIDVSDAALSTEKEELTATTFFNCRIYNNTGPGIDVFASTRFLSTSYVHNVSPVRIDGSLFIENSTFACNDSSAIIKYPYTLPHAGYITTSIFAYNQGAGLYFPWWAPNDTTFYFDITCTNVYLNEGGNFVNVSDSTGYLGNISEDPFFCDTAAGDFSLTDISPCAHYNNACTTRIGANGVGCEDAPPEITAPDTAYATEDQPFTYVLTFDDPDGPDTVFSFEDIPGWCTATADTLTGTPLEGSTDTGFTAIFSDGYKADTQSVVILVAAVNDPPAIDSIGPIVLVEGDSLEVLITATDPESDSITLTAEALPLNAAFVDSGNGTGIFTFRPDSTQAGDYAPTFIASDGTLSDSLTVPVEVLNPEPVIDTLTIKDEPDPTHVVRGDSVIFVWSYVDPYDLKVQSLCEIDVGTDTNWNESELWDPEPFEQSDTTLLYSGTPLVDGETYFARLRVYNSVAWSEWFGLSYRLNSIPSTPQVLSPLNDQITGNQPMLWVLNAVDPEDDVLSYEFFGFHDTDCVNGVPIDTVLVAESPDSTGVPAAGLDSLTENCTYFWQARAFDGHEYSPPSPWQRFHVNGTDESPGLPQLVTPGPESCVLTDLAPTFFWSGSLDPDPLDTVHYEFSLSDNPLFDSTTHVDTVTDTTYQVLTPLDLSRQYWWQVVARDQSGLSAASVVDSFWTWTPGDVDNSHTVNVADLTYLVDHLFRGGPPPCEILLGDADGSCEINVSDLTYLVDNLFRGGPEPQRCPDSDNR